MKALSVILIFCVIFPVSGIALSTVPEPSSDVLFLSIVATETESLGFIQKHQHLRNHFDELSIISSNDCTNLKSGLVLLVSAFSSNRAEVEQALKTAREKVKDSYLRKCDVKSGSLLFFKQDFIHTSLLNLPQDTISWTIDDAKSEIIALDLDYSLLVQRSFTGEADDEVEGRQVSLYLFDNKSHNQTRIFNQCWDPEKPSRIGDKLLFQCMTGVAGNNYIHTAYVYDLTSKKVIFRKEYCQNPTLLDDSVLNCFVESVNASGELTLEMGTFNIR